MSRPTPPASHMLAPATPFIDAGAVEAWDAWVRWRHQGELRDLTIDASWERIAAALAGADPAVGPDVHGHRQAQLRDAFCNWQLLLDPRILASAGTGHCQWQADGLQAALNVAAFVRDPFTAWARFDGDAFEQAASLAVRSLDSAITLVGGATSPRLRIGLVGLADALALLGIPYGPTALPQVRQTGMLLARGCFRASVELAAERGSRFSMDEQRLQQARVRGFPESLITLARQHGLRFATMTAIAPMPRLALLANNVSDALDPLPTGNGWQSFEAPGQSRRLRSAGYAMRLRQQHRGAMQPSDADAVEPTGVPMQIEIRGELSAWIDAPIDYPLRASTPPDPATVLQWIALAAEHALPAPRWRLNSDG